MERPSGRDTLARMLTVVAVLALALSLSFSLWRITFEPQAEQGSVTLGILSWGPQMRTADIEVPVTPGFDLDDYSGITVRTHWWSDAVSTAVDELEKASASTVDLQTELVLARIGMLLTYGAMVALAVAGSMLAAGVRTDVRGGARVGLGWTVLLAGILAFVGAGLTTWAAFGIGDDLTGTAEAGEVDVSTLPGLGFFLVLIAIGLAVAAGILWMRSPAAAAHPAPGRTAAWSTTAAAPPPPPAPAAVPARAPPTPPRPANAPAGTRAVRCPRCSATNWVAPGAKPVCAACGFGS